MGSTYYKHLYIVDHEHKRVYSCKVTDENDAYMYTANPDTIQKLPKKALKAYRGRMMVYDGNGDRHWVRASDIFDDAKNCSDGGILDVDTLVGRVTRATGATRSTDEHDDDDGGGNDDQSQGARLGPSNGGGQRRSLPSFIRRLAGAFASGVLMLLLLSIVVCLSAVASVHFTWNTASAPDGDADAATRGIWWMYNGSRIAIRGLAKAIEYVFVDDT